MSMYYSQGNHQKVDKHVFNYLALGKKLGVTGINLITKTRSSQITQLVKCSDKTYFNPNWHER